MPCNRDRCPGVGASRETSEAQVALACPDGTQAEMHSRQRRSMRHVQMGESWCHREGSLHCAYSSFNEHVPRLEGLVAAATGHAMHCR